MSLVESIIQDAQTMSTNLVMSASNALDAAAGAANTDASSRFGLPDFIFANNVAPPEYDKSFTPFALDGVDTLVVPVPPNFKELSNLPEITMPTPVNLSGLSFSSSSPPNTNLPNAPAAPVVNASEIANEAASVSRPNITTHEAPVLKAVDVPVAPKVTLPTFDAGFTPSSVGAAPDEASAILEEYKSAAPEMQNFINEQLSQWFSQYAPGFQAHQAELQAKISEGMQSGKALSDSFEKALYNRARGRASKELLRVDDEVAKGVSKRGFTLPPAALYSGRIRARQAVADNIATQATEIAIERAKLELQHVQFSMQTGQAVQQMLLDAAMQQSAVVAQINNQALSRAKEIGASLVRAYEFEFKRVTNEIEVFRAEAAVYKTRVSASLAQLEEYKTELEGARLQQELSKSEVDLYRAQVGAETIKLQQYATYLDSIYKKADLEKLKVAVFGEEVKAYSAKVRGKHSEVEVYKASIAGDTARVHQEVAKVDAYGKIVSAELAKQKVEIDRVKADLEANRMLQERYASEVQQYRTMQEVNQSKARIRMDQHKLDVGSKVEANKAKVLTYQAKLDKVKMDFNVADSIYKAKTATNLQRANINLEHIKILADTTFKIGEVYGKMAAAALSSQNSMASQVETVKGRPL